MGGRMEGWPGGAAAALVALVVIAAACPASAADLPADFAGVHLSEGDVGNSRARARALRAQGEVGVRSVRAEFSWHRIEVAPGRFDFAAYDGLVASAARNHVRLLPMLFGPPRFRSSEPTSGPRRGTYPPAQPGDMARFAAVLVGRYGPGGMFWQERPELPYVPIRAWQIWNEPNLYPWWGPGPDAPAYVRLLREVRAGIEACDPDAEVVAAGLPNTQSHLGPKLAPYLQAMYDADGRDAFDTFAIHAYGGSTGNVLRQIEEARAVMDANRDGSPIRVTEFGWGSEGPEGDLMVGPTRQAELVQSTIRAFHERREALGLRAFTYYQWADSPPWPGMPETVWHHIGLLDWGDQPKPALFAYRDTVAELPIPPRGPEERGSQGRCATVGVPGEDAADELTALTGIPESRTVAGASGPRAVSLASVRLRPARFRPRRGRALAPRKPGKRPRRGAVLTFHAGEPSTLEARFERSTRRLSGSLPKLVRVPVAPGRNALLVSGRYRGRRLRAGIQHLVLQLVARDGARSPMVVRQFKIVR